ncbi:MAG: C39 family peptidase [Anaerolineae bacterium]|jgi:tetratricopeptide (TPR) repeat protein|nr:C39 family peptidase [Anaerolineae bacterium]
MSRLTLLVVMIVVGGLFPAGLVAQPPAADLPAAYLLEDVRWEAQKWNNCGPATISNALSYFGYGNNQDRAAAWLKPNGEDKNVSPYQIVDFVNTQVPELNVYARLRYAGNRDLLRRLLANNFPVIIEKGYNPEPERLGWMGHYLLVIGYDDARARWITHDSYIGPRTTYTYDYIDAMWQDFNYTYIVLYPAEREAELNALLGPDADERANIERALQVAREAAIANQSDAFAWFNMGTNFLRLGMYQEAALSYDQARMIGLPWRMLWYQFGPFEAYYAVGRYDDMLALAQANLSDGGGQFVEETYYYGGLARQGKGEYDRALANYEQAIAFNPNFAPAVTARDALLAQMNGRPPAGSGGGG